LKKCVSMEFFKFKYHFTEREDILFITFLNLQYDVTAIGLPGGGGEYETVVGFGWSNGVVLDFLKMYGTILTNEKEGNSSGSASRTTWRFGGTIFITTLSFLWLHLH
jgi:hypothetical protein